MQLQSRLSTEITEWFKLGVDLRLQLSNNRKVDTDLSEMGNRKVTFSVCLVCVHGVRAICNH